LKKCQGLVLIKLIYYLHFKNIIEICKNIHTINLPTVICGAISIVLFVLVRELINEKYKSKMIMPVPMELIIVKTIYKRFFS
jgi:hypothetical protein